MKNCARYAGKSRFRSNSVAMRFGGILINAKTKLLQQMVQGCNLLRGLSQGFNDSDGDDVGDFRGLTAKLDYLEWLGIDCIWLLPTITILSEDERICRSATQDSRMRESLQATPSVYNQSIPAPVHPLAATQK